MERSSPLLVRRRLARAGAWLHKRLFPAALLLLTAGCEDLFDDLLGTVDLPNQILADSLETPSRAALIVEGALADFECAFSAAVAWGALLGDEFSTGDVSFLGEVDRRDLQDLRNVFWAERDCAAAGVWGNWVPLSVARWSSDNALRLLEQWSDAQVNNRQSLIATAALYSGYAHVFLAESFCSITLDVGPEMTPAQVFQRAEQRFDQAINAAQGSSNTTMLHAARLGRARTRLNRGNLNGAMEDAPQVPDGFALTAAYSTVSPRTPNHVAAFNRLSRTSISPVVYGQVSVGAFYRDLRFAGVRDPRVPVQDAGIQELSGAQRLWVQLKYADDASPIPFARSAEARLITAEVAARGGQLQTAVDIINSLHARVGLPAFSSNDQAKVIQQVLYERRAELFLEGHHLGDYRRYELPFDPAVGTPHFTGRPYGDDRCFPLPAAERDANPNA